MSKENFIIQKNVMIQGGGIAEKVETSLNGKVVKYYNITEKNGDTVRFMLVDFEKDEQSFYDSNMRSLDRSIKYGIHRVKNNTIELNNILFGGVKKYDKIVMDFSINKTFYYNDGKIIKVEKNSGTQPNISFTG